jgi:hypothetical protein
MGKAIHLRAGRRPRPLEFTPDPLIDLYEKEVFVFGSNTAGRHGKGAALVARQLGETGRYAVSSGKGSTAAGPTGFPPWTLRAPARSKAVGCLSARSNPT